MARLVEASALLDYVRHLLAGFLAARLAGVGGDKADLPHFGGPLAVVVAVPRGLAEMVLPEVHHLVHERGQRFGRRAAGEVGRVQGDFVGDLLRDRRRWRSVRPRNTRKPPCAAAW